MIAVAIECAACGAVIAEAVMEDHRVNEELDGREFFCARCCYGGSLPSSREREET